MKEVKQLGDTSKTKRTGPKERSSKEAKSITIPYGVIETGEDGLMIDLKEKPEQTFQVNTGVYILNPDVIYEIPDEEFFHITHLMEKVQKRGGRVGCFPVSEHSWKDMGEWPEYLKMIDVL